MMLLVWFRILLRRQLFSRARPRSLICYCSWEPSFCNLSKRSLPIFFFWSNDAAGEISGNSETATFFARALVFVNLPLLSGALLLNFCTRSLRILFIYTNDTPGEISRNSKTPTFFRHALALFNLPLLLGALLFQFSRAIASNIIYLA